MTSKPVLAVAIDPSPDQRTPDAQLLRQAAESAAQESRVQLVRLPAAFEDIDDADIASLVPAGSGQAFVIGPLLRPSTYERLTNILTKAGWRPYNSVDAMLATTRLDRWYPLIPELTAKTVVVENAEGCEDAARTIGLPAFVRGMVKSRKEAGWDACVVPDIATLKRWQALAGPRIAVRELLPLRVKGRTPQNMPETREYRIYVIDGTPVGWSYYWSTHDPWGTLTQNEQARILELAGAVAHQVPATLIGIDVGELEDGRWMVIELN